MGMSEEDLNRVTASSLLGISPHVDGAHQPRALTNGFVYLFAFGAIGIPFLGLVAITLAVHSWQKGHRAHLAMACAVVGTALGIMMWTAAWVRGATF
ncbi:MAG TPA: hypothetical protein VK771_00065 [Acidimicrobiia bacterium]|nr:hypothetical protein [Acidimicrobiia bacterium]